MEPDKLDEQTEVHVTMRVPEDFRRRLRKAAAHVGMSTSAMIRTVMRAWMEDNGLWQLRGPNRETGARSKWPQKVRLEEEERLND